MKRRLLLQVATFIICSSNLHAQQWNFTGNAFNGTTAQGIYFLNADTGFAVSNQQGIARTNDGGADWFSSDSGAASSLSAIDFVSDQVGFVCGIEGSVYKSIDGGTHWNFIGGNLTDDLFCIDFLNDQMGFVGSTNGNIYKTTDGGNNWIVSNAGLLSWITQIHFLDTQTGYAVAGNSDYQAGYILETIDGGSSWSVIYQDADVGFYALAVVSAQLIIVGGSYRTILKSDDSGNSWQVIIDTATLFPVFRCAYAASAERVYLGTSASEIYYTENEGTTWFNTLAGYNGVYSLFFPKPYLGYMGDWAGEIFKLCNTPDPASSISGPLTVCSNSSEQYSTHSIENADSYDWSVPTGSTFQILNDTSILVTFGPSPGPISVKGVNYCGNGDSSLTFITVNPSPSPTISESSGVLFSSEPTGNQWYLNGNLIPGADGNNYSPIVTGNYYVVVTNDLGCTGTSNTIFVQLGPVVINSDFNPVPGDEYPYSLAFTDNVSEGDGGLEVDWDFTQITDSAYLIETYSTPASTPFGTQFPDADVSLQASESFVYYSTDGNTCMVDGYASPDYIVSYQDPLLLYQYPFQFGSTFDDAVSTTFDNNGTEFRRNGTISFLADGEGIITTPNPVIQFRPCVRVNSIENYFDSVFIAGEFKHLYHTSINSYLWISPGIKGAVFKIIDLNFDSEDSISSYRRVLYLSHPVGIKDPSAQNNSWRCYFDPATNQLLLFFNAEWSTKKMSLSIFNIVGEKTLPTIRLDAFSDDNLKIQLPNLASGLYVARLICEEGYSSQKILICR